MPISNYVNPGVYVTQVPTSPFASANSEALNICFLGYTATTPSGTNADYVTISTAPQTSQLSYQATAGSFNVISANGQTTLTSGTDYSVSTGTNYQGNTVSTVTFSGNTTVSGLINQQVSVSYSYSTAQTGTFYTYYDYNSVAANFGSPWSFTASGVAINSPVSLGAYLAFQNGAQSVTCVNISGTGTESDYLTAITSVSGNSVYTNPLIDVIIPLTPVTSTGVLLPGLKNFLTNQANNGVYQRAFVGFSTLSGTLANTVKNMVSVGASTRVSVVAPQAITINPGLNSSTGYSNGTFTLNGQYIAAALAGVFVGQPDVYVPITHKNVVGFVSIPNQVSPNDSQTVQALGGTVIRQRNDGSIYVRHGLTTDTTNWMTQEISINAIGDRLAQNIQAAIDNSTIIGSALTQATLSSLQSIVLATLMRSVDTNLIQSFQNVSYSYSGSSPTTVKVSFQYSPTFPLNYVQVVMSVNTNTGIITTASNINSTTVA